MGDALFLVDHDADRPPRLLPARHTVKGTGERMRAAGLSPVRTCFKIGGASRPSIGGACMDQAGTDRMPTHPVKRVLSIFDRSSRGWPIARIPSILDRSAQRPGAYPDVT